MASETPPPIPPGAGVADQKQVNRVKKSRARRPRKPQDEPGPNGQAPAGTTAGGGIDPEKILPLNPWAETVDLAVDALTSGLHCPARAKNEKAALAVTSRNYLVCKTGRAENAPGIAFAAVAGSLALSIAYDLFKRIKQDRGKNDERTPEPAHEHPGKDGLRKESLDITGLKPS
jgi:hypothetical protein